MKKIKLLVLLSCISSSLFAGDVSTFKCDNDKEFVEISIEHLSDGIYANVKINGDVCNVINEEEVNRMSYAILCKYRDSEVDLYVQSGMTDGNVKIKTHSTEFNLNCTRDFKKQDSGKESSPW